MLLTLLQSQSEPSPAPTQTPAGNVTPGKAVRRRWCKIGDRLYHATEDECSDLLDAFIAKQEGERVELPQVKSKFDRKRYPKLNLDVTVPDVPFKEWDWKPLYRQYVQMSDDYMARMLVEAMRRRSEDDEENAIVLLLH